MNLLRNFSLMNDNYKFMCSSEAFLNLVGRVTDLRLADVPHNPAAASDAIFSLPDVMRLRKDALQILNNLALDINLEKVPLETAARYMNLLNSFLDDEFIANPFVRLGEFGRDIKQAEIPPHIDMAIEAVARIGVFDYNRMVLRRLPEDDLFRTFMSATRLLPLTVHDVIRDRSSAHWLDFHQKVATAVYNLAFLATPRLRSRMRCSPGTVALLARVVRHFSATPGPAPMAVIIRRIGEALGALNSNHDVYDAAVGMTFGANAGVSGWRMAQGESAEPGLLACQEDLALQIAYRREYAENGVLRDLERAIWVGGDDG
jgi:hypothetical protein